MMSRKRKVAAKNKKIDQQLNADRLEITKVLYKVQTNEFYHKKYAQELRELYERVKHDDFTGIFIQCLKTLMQSDFNQYSNTGLKFMAEFVSTFQAEDMHPLFDSIFQWIFKTVSLTPSVRLRLCEFVNLMLNSLPDDGDIEEFHCNEILSYMLERLKDISPHVRVQAIKALCRLQIKDDPTDEVTLIFLFHLSCDPSPLVRQAVITSIARSVRTIPPILERLWDVDVRVRRSVMAHMSNYSLGKCSVEQRLTLLEQGLSDCSEAVRNIAVQITLPQWLALYDNNFIKFLSSLKNDRNESELCRFRRVARRSLLEMFRSRDPSQLVDVLPLIECNEETDNDFHRCIQLDKLTPELSVFWVTLIEHFQSDDSHGEHLEQILPDLVTMCNYVAEFSAQMNRSDDKLSSQFTLLTLVEMLYRFDLSEETGRDAVKSLVVCLLVQRSCEENLTKLLIEICEKLIPTTNLRLQFYVDIAKNIIHPIDVDTRLLACEMDLHTETQAAQLSEKLVELKREQAECLERNEYDKLGLIDEDIASVKERLLFLVAPFLPCEALIPNCKRITSEHLLRALKFIFYGVCSKTIAHLTPSIYQLYEDIISVRIESENLEVRNWALKCTATFSLLYSKIATCAYHAFCKQLFCHQVTSIWVTSIKAIFQLIDRYGVDFLNNNRSTGNLPATENSLLNLTPMPHDSMDDNHNVSCLSDEFVSPDQILLVFHRHLDSCDDADITCELVDGFCMLIVHGRFFDKEIMSKLVVMYCSANVEPKIVQILSVFFETLIRLKKQKYLQLSLSEILTAITTADDPSTENKLRSVLKFIVQSMSSEEKANDSKTVHGGCHRHNDLAVALLTWMNGNATDHKSLNVASKEILSLRLRDDDESRMKLVELVDQVLDRKLYKETAKNLKLFKQTITDRTGSDILEFSSIRPANGIEEDDAASILNEDGEADAECGDDEKDTELSQQDIVNNNETNKQSGISSSDKPVMGLVSEEGNGNERKSGSRVLRSHKTSVNH